ncbi:FtsW/RodA/SpoVE family cell cycle protein [Enterococcus hulanensis]|uniref:Probable peptidoglycan glycosyltransferase FtsW n=1 Tax=Enterococcus hulanensis TaxID=2559929 RepID=A0ABU3F6M6_9ENTE|nr:FtsW/RodA/SpoVE family cell cycle protein [Enterococcus hulanensis]MDT2602567.1 FtsW/RodA/SpoVE family cell cycle protein [Enterococcus hulanensis]MDT2611987.1 FtsW/RodA/SpoVE family cell cycle protein [Enterococcus hulanensis]MDT2619136.1 FtsW/RodA/SpoVE family cell cycle protein [Enterococcus hulanensis]MDT2630721.1 FtsW/RodA/SpoVE family cell cycle protein [Enterococcus hulanensis]MDT2658152.1 FtsW/RodA/SpoVE family cell cycle protein [Enterococcus hulanensis]
MMKRKKIDWLLLLPYLGASLIGLLIVFSASSYRLMAEGENPLTLFSKQAIFMGLSWLLIAVIYRVKSDVLVNGNLAKGLLAVGLVSLLLVKISGVSINGAQRWVSLFGIQFQPSEVTNVALILYLAYFFRVKRTRRELRIPCGLVLLSGLMILLQPKVTGAIIIWGIALVIITTAELPYQLSVFIFLTLIVGIALIGGVILFLGSHQLLPELFAHTYDRIRLVRDPFLDPYGKGFQMSNSYYALYNGGFFGRGLGNSITKKGYLPVAETDFVYSILVEELGVIVGLLVLALLFLIALRLFVLAAKETSQQVSLIYFGVGTLVLLQTSINIASILGLIPMTGVPLPFISYGGTSYLILSMALGICLKFSSEDRTHDETFEQRI